MNQFKVVYRIRKELTGPYPRKGHWAYYEAYYVSSESRHGVAHGVSPFLKDNLDKGAEVIKVTPVAYSETGFWCGLPMRLSAKEAKVA